MATVTRKQPLYDQLVDILMEKIDHEYRPGDLLPSERELSERYAPLFDRTTILSFRVRPTSRILSDHEELVHAVEERDAERAGAIAESHMSRYLENIPEIISAYPAYFAKKD